MRDLDSVRAHVRDGVPHRRHVAQQGAQFILAQHLAPVRREGIQLLGERTQLRAHRLVQLLERLRSPVHQDRLARHQFLERRIEQRLRLRIVGRPFHHVLLGKVVHPKYHRIDFRRAPVALELQFRELLLHRGIHLRISRKAVVELAQFRRKRLLRLNCRLHRLGGGVQAEKALAPDRFPRLLVLHQRLGEIPARELVECLEFCRRVLGEAFKF
ncbi:MAG: hypothetical protein J6X55_14705 [Victivallales bacterium]|nr:hypothetical protein [Victivallales bacterium]